MICTHCYNYIHNNYIIIILLLNCAVYRTLLNGPEGDHIMIHSLAGFISRNGMTSKTKKTQRQVKIVL